MTSQFFANIYLNGLDHYLKEQLRCRHYLRYMDDFLLFSKQKEFLWEVKKKIIHYLESLQLKLHENKCRIFKTKMGFPFLGMLLFPYKRRLKRQNVIRFKRKLKKFEQNYRKGELGWHHINQSIQSWLGYAQYANAVTLKSLLLRDLVFQQQKEN